MALSVVAGVIAGALVRGSILAMQQRRASLKRSGKEKDDPETRALMQLFWTYAVFVLIAPVLLVGWLSSLGVVLGGFVALAGALGASQVRAQHAKDLKGSFWVITVTVSVGIPLLVRVLSGNTLAVLVGLSLLIHVVVEASGGIKVWERRMAAWEAGAKAKAHPPVAPVGVEEMSPREFELLVADTLRENGWLADATAASGDFGIDVVASRGERSAAIQVKRYLSNVGVPAVQQAVAGRLHYGCDEAWVVTTKGFTKAAVEFAESTGCVLLTIDELPKYARG